MNIVLHEPEIPFNTGAIGRTCVATGTVLHLIRPYGFLLNDRNLKRAGMDYWEKLRLFEYRDYTDFRRQHSELCLGSHAKMCTEGDAPRLWFATTKARQIYSEVCFGMDDYIMFGKESAGIPEEILAEHPESCIRIPMYGDIRSLNLSNSVSVLLYEALRQNDFGGLRREGALHRLHWREGNAHGT